MNPAIWLLIGIVILAGAVLTVAKVAGKKSPTLNEQVTRHTADLNLVRFLLQRNRKIEAIKVYREETGAGLAEAKAAVEQLARDDTPSYADTAGAPDGFAEVRRHLDAGKKIEAIKLYRQRTGATLREAKEAVEAMTLTGGSRLGADQLDSVRQLMVAGKKIDAVKLYRQRTGVSLREAKDAVERLH